MNFRTVLAIFVCGFVVFCGWLVTETGFFQAGRHEGLPCILLQQATTTESGGNKSADAAVKQTLEAADFIRLWASDAQAKTVTLGSIDPRSGFKFEYELTSKAAAIKKATLSEFDDRHYKNPQPLVILSPADSEIMSMANTELVLTLNGQEYKPLPMDRLHWESLGVERGDGSETATFVATITVKDTGAKLVKLIKTYKIKRDSYLLECDLTIENLTDSEQKASFNLAGPVGIGIEDVRGDMRNVIGGFLMPDGQVVASRKDLLIGFPMNLFTKNVGLKDTTRKYEEALRTRDPDAIQRARADLRVGRNLEDSHKNADFLWAAATNKYFTAIVRPVPREGQDYCDWIQNTTAQYYNPDEDQRGNTGDETIGVNLEIAESALPAAGRPGSTKTYNFQLYLGPKDKSIFDKNELYTKLGFAHTVTLRSCCCCPESIIKPLSFVIFALMKFMYGFIGNYGVVIIILVFVFRIAMHPITKKSQVSMNKFTKIFNAPEVQEIKKKYAKSPMEMQKRISEFQKERGISPMTPIMGMLPMFVQMPIWIALWSSVNASIELRGKGFLPFWITDLSMPDALVRFTTITLPLLGWKIESLNLLPILMGVAFYLQQKLMPKQASVETNPQMAQQQKMMMIMLPLMFPLMLYKAPSGVNLYIMASTFAGVFEQYVIRKHIREKEEVESRGLVAVTSKTGGKVKKKKPKPFYRM